MKDYCFKTRQLYWRSWWQNLSVSVSNSITRKHGNKVLLLILTGSYILLLLYNYLHSPWILPPYAQKYILSRNSTRA